MTARGQTPLPPLFGQRDFLPGATVDALLDYAVSNRALFQPTSAGRTSTGAVRAALRMSLGTRELGRFRAIIENAMSATLPRMITALHLAPIDVVWVELELVAHGDGAFYRRHVDLNRTRLSPTMRALSAVYYFHAAPKAFGGGALRLYPIGDAPADRFVDVPPQHNSLAAFPSWMPHEVMPVSCPSGRFEDSRFAINCWLHVARPTGPA